MGIVYRAHDNRLNRLVALKVVAPHLARDPEYRERFLKEARAGATIDHRSIVPIYEIGETAEELYIAMRLVDGEDLRAYLRRRGHLEVSEAVELLTPIAEALDAASRIGLVHRDVKPANILLSSENREVLLGDFGLAKALGEASLTVTGQFIGTADYSAPEQARGGVVDGRTDQYSLACVLYELISGVPPLRRDQALQTLFAQVHEEPPRISTQSDELNNSLLVALRKDPAHRYESCGSFLRAVLQADLPPTESASDLTERLSYPSDTLVAPTLTDVTRVLDPVGDKQNHRRGLKWAVFGAAVVILLGVVALVWAGSRGGSAPIASDAAITASRTIERSSDCRAAALAIRIAIVEGGKVSGKRATAEMIGYNDAVARFKNAQTALLLCVSNDPNAVGGEESLQLLSNVLGVIPTVKVDSTFMFHCPPATAGGLVVEIPYDECIHHAGEIVKIAKPALANADEARTLNDSAKALAELHGVSNYLFPSE